MKRSCSALVRTLLAAMVSAVCQWAHAATPSVYSFAVAPQFEQRKLYAAWRPIIDELQRRTGLQFSLVTTLTIQDFGVSFEREILGLEMKRAFALGPPGAPVAPDGDALASPGSGTPGRSNIRRRTRGLERERGGPKRL